VKRETFAVSPMRSAGTVSGCWTDICGNSQCRTGWLHLFRRRSFPRFEEKWACSARCMEQIVAEAVRSQIESWQPAGPERALRMPLGLILLSRGWITRQELQEALAAQRSAGSGRIGEWLRRLHGISEEAIKKALGIQWSCTVLPSGIPALEFAPSQIPAFLRKKYGLALLRQGPDAALYVAGRYRAEHAAARALEHMLGEPVHAAFLEDSAWGPENMDAVDSTELHLPGQDGVVACITELLEQIQPTDARLVRMHDHLWLRVWPAGRTRKSLPVRDLVFPLRHELSDERAAKSLA
jgi:hypothetical protein